MFSITSRCVKLMATSSKSGWNLSQMAFKTTGTVKFFDEVKGILSNSYIKFVYTHIDVIYFMIKALDLLTLLMEVIRFLYISQT